MTVAVAGGGIIGLSLAWRLAQHGCSVTVFDKGRMGGEASWAGAGMLAPGGEVVSSSPIAQLAIAARALYPSFVRELEEASGSELEGASGSRIDFQECGALDLAYSPEDRQTLETRAAHQVALGIRSEWLDPEHVLALCPPVRSAGLLGARFYPDDAIVNPREITAGLCAVCRSLGVSLLEHRPLEEATARPFDAIVIAAGAWSSRLPIGGLPLAEPVKGHLIGYQLAPGALPRIVRHGHTYLLQRASGFLIAGSSEERAGFDRSVDPAIVADIARRAAFLLPHLARETPAETWTGFRPASDRLHTERHDPAGHLYLAYGHYRNGILLAPVTARDLASEISANFEKRSPARRAAPAPGAAPSPAA